MAEYLNKAAGRMVILGVVACALGGVHAIVAAQALPDPTRPPSMMSAEQHASATPVGPVLQSILVSPRRAEAIISGRTVRVGDRVGDAKVVRITETEVHLREGKNLQTLKLFPNIEKQSDSGQSPSRFGAKVDKR